MVAVSFLSFSQFRGNRPGSRHAKKSPPSRRGQRAKYFAVPPLVRRTFTRTALGRANTRQRGNGRTRSTPTGQNLAVGVPAPRGIRRSALSPFHQTRGSLCSAETGTLPLHHCSWYSIRFCSACQQAVSGVCIGGGSAGRGPASAAPKTFSQHHGQAQVRRSQSVTDLGQTHPAFSGSGSARVHPRLQREERAAGPQPVPDGGRQGDPALELNFMSR